MVRAINLANMSERHLPAAGGLLDQSAWFFDLLQAVKNDQDKIDADRIEGMTRGR
jgi:hypothetical protein